MTESEYENFEKKLDFELPIWIKSKNMICYKEKEIIGVKEKENIVAIYVLPIYRENNKVWIERTFRYFPYLSPVMLYKYNNLKKRAITYEIFKYVFEKYDLMYMPMHPTFKDISSIQSLGAFVECRHTHVTNKKINIDEMTSKLRNEIRNAKKQIEILIDRDIEKFRFDIAIRGNLDEQKNRTANAIHLINSGQGVIISANQEGKICAGIIVVYDNEWAYLLHSWQNGELPRGTVICLILEAINWVFENQKIKYFDLEGSVIDNVDIFFSKFNFDILLYPYVHFGKKYGDFENLINISKDIEGRKIHDLCGNRNEKGVEI